MGGATETQEVQKRFIFTGNINVKLTLNKNIKRIFTNTKQNERITSRLHRPLNNTRERG